MHKGYLDTADGQIHYWSEGSGPDLLAIHQAGQCSEEYRGLAAHLRDSYRIWAIDLPGHGPSENPAQEFEVDDYTRVTTALLDAQEGRCAVCAERLEITDAVAHNRGNAPVGLHPRCSRLAELADTVGRGGIDRLRALLWPDRVSG